MQLKASYIKKQFYFQKPAGTSRGVYLEKNSYFVLISDEDNPVNFGIGEAAPLRGLSIDSIDNFEEQLQEICDTLNEIELEIFEFNISILINSLIPSEFPSIRFGFETAMFDFLNGQRRIIFDNDFSKGNQTILINGLVWMNDFETMKAEIHQKVKEGYRTIKIKVGAIDFNDELALLHEIRDAYGYDIEIRLDANGAFEESNVYQKLNALSDYRIHSIEQPIKPKNLEFMAKLCSDSPIKIALDEELIGYFDYLPKMNLLKKLNPPFIVLKPTLLGGFFQCQEWIEIANRLDIQWWITSALETNIGLNAIAQFAANYDNKLPQGLGTGQLYKQNVTSPLHLEDSLMTYQKNKNWDLSILGI